jgi:hypothetical protein
MKDFRPQWKALARECKVTVEDVLFNCILRAMYNSRYDDDYGVSKLKVELTKSFVYSHRVHNEPYIAVRLAAEHLYSRIFGAYDFQDRFTNKHIHLLDYFETQEELGDFKFLLTGLMGPENLMSKQYVYFFVRQDLSKEQVVVQTAHAASVIASKIPDKDWTKISFVVIGVASEEELADVVFAIEPSIANIKFREPDIKNQVTAIATYPMNANNPNRKWLKRYELLTF